MSNYSEDDMKLAEEVGNLFGGNGLSHKEQLVLVAERLAEWRFHAYEEGYHHAKKEPIMP